MIALLIGFSAAEWGVLDVETGKVISSLPKQAYPITAPVPKPVRAPVIYFYGELPKEITLSLDVSPKKITAAEPAFVTMKGKPSWKIKPYDTKREESEPLCWIDPEATVITANDRACDYIFYEAEVNYDEMLVAIDFKPEGGILHNMSKYPVHDVLWLVYNDRGEVLGAYLPYMNPGDTASVRFAEFPREVPVLAKLKALGFADGAARAFYNEWWPVFTKTPVSPPTSSLPGMISLSYRLSREEVDNLLPINMNPEPERLIRAWWVLVR